MKTDNKNKVISEESFNAQNSRRTKLTKDIVVFFLVAVALVAAVSVVVALKENDFKFRNIIASINPDAQTTTEETTVPDVLSGRVNFLLVLSDSTTGALRYASILNTDLNTLSMRMYMLPDDTFVTANGYTGNWSEQYLYGGMNQLVLAVEEMTGISIERYMSTNDRSFLDTLKLFDNITYTVPESVNCILNGISYTIEAGTQQMTPDTVQKYLIYLCDNDMYEETANLLCGIINSYLTPGIVYKSDSLFKRLSNIFDTDISAMDYAKYSEKIASFITNEERVPAAYSEDLTDF